MWKFPTPLAAPWRRLAVASNERAVANARTAATELGRLLVERHEVDLYLAARAARTGTAVAREGRPA